ncbi:predicted protein [Sclerotinia sclerotiorum 1980 UF-70]|uniref:Uncharacterized protein n=1 Tax=Sclerotinia sclerotiorum (strain ATCC 18683 / 1980 / Ss-1) TaxID=665079 RepID=A7F4T5_SCLS1|nr:predicted protein [Sclerotinia sclerotiorum 1980 UF-70]EDN97756.1 predicted protein [Sclerotinia sclerotiorum 1980 UF-70]
MSREVIICACGIDVFYFIIFGTSYAFRKLLRVIEKTGKSRSFVEKEDESSDAQLRLYRRGVNVLYGHAQDRFQNNGRGPASPAKPDGSSSHTETLMKKATGVAMLMYFLVDDKLQLGRAPYCKWLPMKLVEICPAGTVLRDHSMRNLSLELNVLPDGCIQRWVIEVRCVDNQRTEYALFGFEMKKTYLLMCWIVGWGEFVKVTARNARVCQTYSALSRFDGSVMSFQTENHDMLMTRRYLDTSRAECVRVTM